MSTAWAEARSIPVPESGCWLWLGADKGNGYGHATHERKSWPAHRLAYHLCRGPVPDGVDVCHRCDTRLCVNPGHLFLGTRTDNMRDAKRKGRLSSGRRHALTVCGENGSGAKLSAAQVLSIRAEAEAGATPKELAARHAVGVDNIRRILRRDTWKELSPCEA